MIDAEPVPMIKEVPSQDFPPLWQETDGDTETILYNERLKLRYAFKEWATDQLAVIDQAKDGDPISNNLFKLSIIDSYIRAVHRYTGAMANIDFPPSKDYQSQAREQLQEYFTQLCGEQSLAIAQKDPETASIYIQDDAEIRHDMLNQYLYFAMHRQEAQFTPELRQQLREDLQIIKTVTEGNIIPFTFSGNQIQEMIKTKFTNKQIKTLVTMSDNPMAHDLEQTSLQWSATHFHRLTGNIVQNLSRMYTGMEVTNKVQNTTKPVNRSLQVSYELSQDKGYFLVHFDDTGTGYDAELLGTNPFKRGVSKHSGAIGEGIGMYGIQKSLVEDLDGFFHTENRKDDQGTISGGRLTVGLKVM